jgi:hypothetical protein
MQGRDGILKGFLEAPYGHLDEAAKPRIEEIIGLSDEECLKPLVFLLDDCVFFGWTSSFSLKTLHFVYEQAGGNPAFVRSLEKERKQRFKDGFGGLQ